MRQELITINRAVQLELEIDGSRIQWATFYSWDDHSKVVLTSVNRLDLLKIYHMIGAFVSAEADDAVLHVNQAFVREAAGTDKVGVVGPEPDDLPF